jgi:hypothetical protein
VPSSVWGILVERKMRPTPVVVDPIASYDPMKIRFVQDDQMVEAFPTLLAIQLAFGRLSRMNEERPCMAWTVYMLKCADTSLYTGITVDLDRGLDEHSNGKGPKIPNTVGLLCCGVHRILGNEGPGAEERS